MADPLGELARVRDGGREEDEVDVVGQQDDRLLPDDAALLVAHVVDLVEDDPGHLAHHLRAAVQHRAQNLQPTNTTTPWNNVPSLAILLR